VSRLENLIEQTTFLLAKQKEAQEQCDLLFKDFLHFLHDKITEEKNFSSESKEHLKRAQILIRNHSQNISDETESDINFLNEQVDALKKIQLIKDEKKAQECLLTLIDEDEEVIPTEDFKNNVNQESKEAYQGLCKVIRDIKDAISEGNHKQVELLLEALLIEDNLDEQDNDYGDINSLDDPSYKQNNNTSSCCSSSKGCNDCNGCSFQEGTNPFGFTNNYDRELEKDNMRKNNNDIN
jgi:hypothetical protein